MSSQADQSDRSGVALVGAGYMGQEYAKALGQTGSLTLAGVVGKTPARAALLCAENPGALHCASISELYERTKAKAVIIAVPELASEEAIHEALKFPWMLLIEKPPGYLPSMTERLLRAATVAGREVFVALNRRFYGSTSQAMAALESDEGIRALIIQDQEDQAAALAIGQPKEVVDAWMYANSIHIVDYAKFFCRGTLSAVKTITGFRAYEPCVVQAQLQFSSGDSASYIALWQRPGPWSVQISTEKQRLELRPLELLSSQKKGERHLHEHAKHQFDVDCKPGIRALCEELSKAVNGRPHHLPSLATGYELMTLIQSIYE